MNLRRKFKTAANIWRKNGLSGLKAYLRFKTSVLRQKFVYRKWVKNVDTLNDEDRENLCREIEQLPRKPLISIILPVYDVDEKWLRQCIESVRVQLYRNWELCIADDYSPSEHIRPMLEEYARSDSRMKLVFRNENGHISAASNSALELATGEFTVLLDHDDELSEHALYYVAKELIEHPDVQMIYSDEDLINKRGRRYGPKFKPDWSPDLFYSANLITHLSAYKTSLLKKIGGFTVGLEGSQDYDLALRVIEEIPESQIRHIPRILYHWRVIESSVAADGDAKPYAHQAARDAIASHLKRTGKKATVTQTVHNLHRVRYELPARSPKVSLITISDEDINFTLNSLKTFADKTAYAELEIITVCSKANDQGCLSGLEALGPGSLELRCGKTIVIESDLRNEPELLNLAVSVATGEVVCFVDPNLMPISNTWLKELVSFAVQKEIGAVGAKLLYQNGTILHGGLLIGVGGTVGIAHNGWPAEADGNITRARLIGNYSAVSVSCMAVRRKLFEKVGGFNKHDYPNRLFDADFCLRLGKGGLRMVWSPYAVLRLVDNRKLLNVEKEIDKNEIPAFRKAWRPVVERDPFYNPNLSRENGRFFLNEQN